MAESNYRKIYSGNIFVTQQIQQSLNEVGIKPVVKDVNESGRLAGFGTTAPVVKDVFVHKNEYEKAVLIVVKIIK